MRRGSFSLISAAAPEASEIMVFTCFKGKKHRTPRNRPWQSLWMELLDGTTGGDVICEQTPKDTHDTARAAGPAGPACMAMGVRNVLHLTRERRSGMETRAARKCSTSLSAPRLEAQLLRQA